MKLHIAGYFPGYPHDAPRHLDMDLAGPTGLEEILSRLGIPAAEVHMLVINGQLVEIGTVQIFPADEVSLYPAMDGG